MNQSYDNPELLKSGEKTLDSKRHLQVITAADNVSKVPAILKEIQRRAAELIQQIEPDQVPSADITPQTPQSSPELTDLTVEKALRLVEAAHLNVQGVQDVKKAA